MKKIALSLVFAGTLLIAQKISQIQYVGLAHLSPSMATEVSGIQVGDEMDIAKINQSVKNFYAQGYFEDVWVESKGNALIYHFKEKVAIANLEIKGFGTGDEGEKLLASTGLKKGDLYDQRRVKEAKKALISNLESQGYYDTVVEVTTTKVSESSVSLVFDVNKGEKITIQKMNLVGAKEVDQGELEANLANKEVDFWGWIPFLNDGVAKVDQLEYDSYRVKEAYMQKGYLDADVSKPLMKVDFGSYNADIDYQIKEGIKYSIGKITIAQNLKGVDSKELIEELSLKSGKVFNINRMRSDINHLKEKIGNRGYAYVDVVPQMHKDEKAQTIDLNYVIKEGVPVTVNDVLISGNSVTKDRVIRRYIYLAPGDKYNATDLKDSKNALGRTGFFEKVDIETQRVSEDKINLLVKVTEAPTGTISAGGGYGSYEGLMVNASVSDKNLFGSGISSTVGFELSKISKNYNVSFTNPRVWDSLYSLGLSVYKRDYEYIDFKQNQLGGNLSLGREFYRHFYASVGVGYVDNQSEINSDVNSTYIQNIFYNDKYQKVSGFASLKFDNTDDYYQPREGFIAAANVELASLNGDLTQENIDEGYTEFANLTKFSGKIGAYYGMAELIDYDLILRAKARFTVISAGDNEYLPIAEKLFMGGVGSVRGYDPYSLSPTVITDNLGNKRAAADGELPNYDLNETSSRIGGTKSASVSLEASVPLSEAAKMRLAFFVDYGIIGTDPIPTKDGDLKFENIARASTGAVVEWQSGFGPINLVFAKAINPKDGDRTSVFEFSMGTKF
ncbi:outer membrane protein assembly factor BamA [Sulfurovum sp. zt1-1]|uniref:Outer membrane protein assembly factor BamA n=1 Tax=Sulfurovum zhangzhouensis TaxID=3019067 RepID=A0ABT7QX31_9BACT|nr:outer membrane protein assembly factor BamA [Sulfurovum zhangzhouensis]MDM5271306.1 outer membrane protein assembly factor BamA [Sulfurovum zhangzhouensis]